MAETIALSIAESAVAAGYLEVASFALNYGTIALQLAAVAASTYVSQEQRRKAANAQRAAYEASLRDRYVMFRSATEPRQVVLGRQRVSGPMAYVGSYGANREHLVFCVIVASHEIDAVEAIYFDDERLQLDGSGNVISVARRDIFSINTSTATFTLTSTPAGGSIVATVAYGSTQVVLGTSVSGNDVTVTGATAGTTGTLTIQYQPAQSPWVVATDTDSFETFTTDGAGAGSITLAVTPNPGSVRVFYAPVGPGGDASVTVVDVTAEATIAGTSVSVADALRPASQYVVQYRDSAYSSRARVQAHLGAPGQAADANMLAALPGVWTSAHTMTGLAYLRVELDYNTDAFPSGLPNVSATVRGAKLYDPRTGVAAWSENPALMMRHVATSPLLGWLETSAVGDTSIAVAATICDGAAAYVVNGQTFNRSLYTAGLVLKSDVRAKDALDDLAKAMGGRWCFVDGQLRVKAGAYTMPLQSLDDSWLAGGAVQVQPKAARGDIFNVAAGKFADESRDYIVTDYPRVTASAYVTEDGAELPIEVQLNAVTFSGQAQQVVAVQMRDARQGLRTTLTCNMRAYLVEPFDTLSVTLPRFGWVNKVSEVLDVSWLIDGGIQLVLKETDPSIWALGTEFAAADPAPNTLFPSPFKVPAITGLACASGTGQLLRQADGTVQTRVQVTWDAITDALVNMGGGIEIRYGIASAPEDMWQSVDAAFGQSTAFLTANLRDGQTYMVKARAYNGLVKGAWCLPVVHQVIGKTAAPGNVAGLAAANLNGDVLIYWTPSVEADYDYTELRHGSSYAAGTFIAHVTGSAFPWAWLSTPGAGAVSIWAKHYDTSGNPSATATGISVTITTPSLAGLDSVAAGAITAAALAASNAQADASSALTKLTSIASDSILSPGEKPAAVQDYAVVTGEQAGIDAQATAYSITTEKTAYDNAVTALTAYLGGLSGWNTIPGTDVAIVGTTWRSTWAAVYTARQALLDRIAAVAGTVAVWTGITGTGKPADNATVNRVSYSASAPSSPVDGDLWCDTSATPAVWKIRVSGAWQPAANYTTGALANLNTVGTGHIDAGAVTLINTQSISGVSVTQVSGVPNNTAFFWTDVASYTFTAAHTGPVTITAIGGVEITTPAVGSIWAALYTSLDVGAAYGADVSYQLELKIGNSASYRGNFAHTREIAVTAGSSYTVTLRAQRFGSDTPTTMVQGVMRTEQIKR